MALELDTPTNQRKAERLRELLERLLSASLQRGWHGIATLEFSVHDGTVQSIRHRVERLEK